MLISKKQLKAMIQFSFAHIDRMEDPESPYYDATFPKRVRVGFRVFWVTDEVLAWIGAQIERRDRSSG